MQPCSAACCYTTVYIRLVCTPPPSAGKYSTEDNLLHLCLRHKLSGAAMELLASKQLMLQYLHQKSGAAATAEAGGDGKTPLEMAKRNNMKKVAQTLERLQVCTIV